LKKPTGFYSSKKQKNNKKVSNRLRIISKIAKIKRKNCRSKIMENWKKKVAVFLISQTVSLLGSMLVGYTIMWYITIGTQSCCNDDCLCVMYFYSVYHHVAVCGGMGG